jgi:hypothetical protein
MAGQLAATLVMLTLTACAVRATGRQGEQPPSQEDPQRAVAQVVREMQMDLEAASSAGLLRKIDSAKFDDFPRFQDMIERLTREDTLRVFFRQVRSDVKQDTAQTLLDAEMELTRKDSSAAPERRRQQLTIDLERTSRGWRIVNITPRDFFRPL